MSNKPPQDLKSHAHFVPGFHVVTFLLLIINLGWSVTAVIRDFGTATLIAATTALGLVLLSLYARLFATQNQDRIIRLEERLRLERVLPDDLRARVNELSTGQLVGLRFAQDNEVADLVRTVLSEGIGDRQEIKRRIKNWRPDFQRV